VINAYIHDEGTEAEVQIRGINNDFGQLMCISG